MQKITAHNNNFNLLRLAAAFFVLVSHSYGLLNKALLQPGLWYSNKHLIASDVGLAIFFTISGFLVTQSLFSSNSLGHYAVKRALRIFPALVVVNLFCIILGLFITTLPAKTYLSSANTWLYFFKNTTLVVNQFTLPGVFERLQNTSVNASLWTLWLEVQFYIALMLFASTVVVRGWLLITLFAVFEGLRTYLVIIHSTQIRYFDLEPIFTYGTYFYLGVLYYRFKNEVPLRWFYANILMAIALVTVYTVVAPITEAVFFAYCILTIGTAKSIIDLKGYDVSYGFYLYAFPVQQLIIFVLGYQLPVWLHIFLSSCITLLLAFLSWQYVEKPFLKLKFRWL